MLVQKFKLFVLTTVILTQCLINAGEAGQPPKISEHPADSVVPRNEPVTLNCKAEGDPPPSISWTKDGKPLIQLSDSRQLRFPLPSGSLFFLRGCSDDQNGRNTGTVNVNVAAPLHEWFQYSCRFCHPNNPEVKGNNINGGWQRVRSQDSGVYACRASNSYGQVTSRDATLEVATLREEFRASPQNTWIAQGETAVLECEPPRGNPEPKVFWKKNGQPIDIKGNGRYKMLGLGTLSIAEVKESDEGVYVCGAKSIVGIRQSSSALLRVTVRPQFTIVPSNTSALLGSDVSLVCVARGDPPPEISWNKERGSLPLKRARFDEERFLISNVSAEDAGVYRCIAENKAGSIVSSATVTVLSPPILTIIPQDIEVQPNSTVYLECQSEGDPRSTLFWFKEGSHSVIFQGTSAQNHYVSEEGTLKIDNVSERDEGSWVCAAVSYAGSVMHKMYLKVTPFEDLPPPIIHMGPSNQSKTVGSVAVMPCHSQGYPKPIITWYKNSNSFPLNHRVFTDDGGTLRINDLNLQDSGMYECVASSRSGKYVWRSYLTVESNAPNGFNIPTSSGGGRHRMGYDFGNSVTRPSPMKPHIVKVDSTSVTIAWHPKYFSINVDGNGDDPPDPSRRGTSPLTSRRFLKPLSRINDDEESMLDDQALLPVESDRRHGGGNENKNDDSETEFARTLSSLHSQNPLPRRSNDDERERSRGIEVERDNFPRSPHLSPGEGNEESDETDEVIVTLKNKNVETDEDEEESEYGEEKSTFSAVVKKIAETEEDEEESNQNKNNLIIQSTRTMTTGSNSTTTTTISSSNSSGNHKGTQNFLTSTSTFRPITSFPVPSQITSTFLPLRKQITFNVEYYSPNEVRSEWLLGANVPIEVVTLQYLKPNAEYIFFVRSVSADGILSPPSPLSDPVITSHKDSDSDLRKARGHLESPIVVLLKTAYATSSSAIRIEWQIVNAGEYTEGFYIYYRQPSDEGNYQMLTVLNTGALTFQISGLEKFTTYQIFLIPFYKNVDGRPSNYLNVTTAQDVPSVAPEILDTVPVNSSALVIRWKPAPIRYHHGIIIGYQLRVWSGPSLVGNMTTDASTLSLLLNNLTPGQSYSLQIGSFTIKGVGVFSSMKTLHFRPETNVNINHKIGFNTGLNNQDGRMSSIPGESQNKGWKNMKESKSSFDGNNINFGKSDFSERNEENGESNEMESSSIGGRGLNKNLVNLYGDDGGPASTNHHQQNDFLTEAWFIALIGSVIFLMLLVFVFALYMRRCQLRKDMDKLKVSTNEIPDGSIPPHYPDDNLWIDSQQSKQLSLKSVKTNNDLLNEYENGNNYAVVEDRHSPIAYASTTLINGEKHKSSFSMFGESAKSMSLLNGGGGGGMIGGHIVSRPNGFGMMASPKMVGWASGIGTTSNTGGPPPPSSNKTGSLSICPQDVKKDIGKGTSLNVLTTFQTPLPTRKHMIVDFSKGNSVNTSILQYHEPRLNSHSQLPNSHNSHSHSHAHNHNGHTNNSSLF